MEKKKPSYSLDRIKELIRRRKYTITDNATQAGDELGFARIEIAEMVLELSKKDFCKSMTDIKDHRIWHDVYKKSKARGDQIIPLYIKIIVYEEVIIVSFKHDEGAVTRRKTT